MFTGEFFIPTGYEHAANSSGYGVDVVALRDPWEAKVASVFTEAHLKMPSDAWAQEGGKEGRHTEHLGYLLAEMQYLQRTYPNATW
jgi:ring-1,2-phenylacetyl-CoA epoxidase subunit PaaC